jgi:hypothetical protein
MEYLFAIGIILLIVSIIVILWVRGIDYMTKNHPEYKGEDFLNWGEDVHQRAGAGRDGWDSIESDDNWYPHETL